MKRKPAAVWLAAMDNDLARKPRPLAANPPQIVERALEIVRPHLLYELLKLSSLSGTFGDRYSANEKQNKREVARLEKEAKRWRAVSANALKAAYGAQGSSWSQLDDVPIARERDIREDGPPLEVVDVKAIALLQSVADNASQIAERAEASARELKQSPARARKWGKRVVRERAEMLVEKLGWKLPDVADLVVASTRAWVTPPLKLSPALQNNPTLVLQRLRDLVDPRNDRPRKVGQNAKAPRTRQQKRQR